MNRREFNKMAGLAVTFASLGGSIVFASGCSSKTIAEAIIDSFGKILDLLNSAGIVLNKTLLATARAALAAFKAAYDAFQKGTGTAEKLAQAAQAALDALQAFFQATGIGGPLALAVTALAEVILSELESFLPVPSPAFKLGGKSVTIPPVKRDLKQYIHDFNAACVAVGHKELEIH